MAPLGLNSNSPSVMNMNMHERQDSLVGSQYGQVIDSNHVATSFSRQLSLQHLHNSYSQPYLASNQRMATCPPNGSHNQCTSLNANMSNGAPMQCAPGHHATNGMMTANQNAAHLEMSGPGGLKSNHHMNSSMSMGASAMYASANVPLNGARMRPGAAAYSTAAGQQQQQQFPTNQNKRTASAAAMAAASVHQYPMSNGAFANVNSNSMASSYGPQSQTHQFNNNQVRLWHYLYLAAPTNAFPFTNSVPGNPESAI